MQGKAQKNGGKSKQELRSKNISSQTVTFGGLQLDTFRLQSYPHLIRSKPIDYNAVYFCVAIHRIGLLVAWQLPLALISWTNILSTQKSQKLCKKRKQCPVQVQNLGLFAQNPNSFWYVAHTTLSNPTTIISMTSTKLYSVPSPLNQLLLLVHVKWFLLLN